VQNLSVQILMRFCNHWTERREKNDTIKQMTGTSESKAHLHMEHAQKTGALGARHGYGKGGVSRKQGLLRVAVQRAVAVDHVLDLLRNGRKNGFQRYSSVKVGVWKSSSEGKSMQGLRCDIQRVCRRDSALRTRFGPGSGAAGTGLDLVKWAFDKR
jgi:hypothetical protein